MTPATRILAGLLLLSSWPFCARTAAQAAPTAGQTPAPAAAQSADPCAASVTQMDLDLCYAAQFKAVSLSLNHVYRAALVHFERDRADAEKRSSQSQMAFDDAALSDLKAAQTAWIKYRDLHCQAAGQQVQGGSIQPTVLSQCMTLVTQHRIDELRAAYEIGGRKLE